MLFGELVDFFFQFLDHRFLRHFPDNLAFAEQEAFAACAGNPDIGFTRFSGTVDGTAENGNLIGALILAM